ncbi:MAG: hypothetical protein Ct9H300mP4_05800 [Gammaproteobacteria bacterium]|nr:MAG: hypothetical protein Ct9H300mP4_05800 [Gammaproteobacteria bacterium]
MQRRLIAASLIAFGWDNLKMRGKMNPTQVSVAKWNNTRMALDLPEIAEICWVLQESVPGKRTNSSHAQFGECDYLRRHRNHSSISRWRHLTGKNAF